MSDPYATVAELKSRMQITVNSDDTRLSEALNAASRDVDKHCRRTFNKDTAATARIFKTDTPRLARVDDFHTTAGLVIQTDGDDDGTFETTWTAAETDYELRPLNGVVEGESGWPFSRIYAVSTPTFPTTNKRSSLRVTAQWGWAAVPAGVKESTLILAEGLFKLKDAPHGVAGFDGFGAVRVRENPYVCMLLEKYRRDTVLVA